LDIDNCNFNIKSFNIAVLRYLQFAYTAITLLMCRLFTVFAQQFENCFSMSVQ